MRDIKISGLGQKSVREMRYFRINKEAICTNQLKTKEATKKKIRLVMNHMLLSDYFCGKASDTPASLSKVASPESLNQV